MPYLSALLFSALVAARMPLERVAPEKFIPTFAIKYGSMDKGVRPPEETAKFDLLIVSASRRADKVWARGGKNSWRTLKSLNPDMVILVYKNGPTRYNTASWGQMGEGWEWMKKHHGVNSPDRWMAKGVKYGTYLQSPHYPNERLAIPGNPRWRRYWVETVYEDFWGGRKGIDFDGVDGIFADNTNYYLPTDWHAEGRPDLKDLPESYFREGRVLYDKWRADINAFFNEAVPWFVAKGLLLVPNFGPMGKHPEHWRELDSLPHPPFAAMDEVGFICPYGRGGFNTWNWERRLKAMWELKNVKVLMNAHVEVESDAKGLKRMEVYGVSSSHGDRMNGWEALWFAMTSFLLGFDDVRRNGFMNFTIWGYTEYHWFDEFDPRYLHLGRARGRYWREGRVYFREFDDGWVVVNPSREDAKGVSVPKGRARVINHYNFKRPDSAPLVRRFDLPKHRGVILLKEGRKIGNEDNL